MQLQTSPRNDDVSGGITGEMSARHEYAALLDDDGDVVKIVEDTGHVSIFSRRDRAVDGSPVFAADFRRLSRSVSPESARCLK